MGSVAEFDKAIELDPRQKACMFLIFFLGNVTRYIHMSIL